jgi:hypothetical protein
MGRRRLGAGTGEVGAEPGGRGKLGYLLSMMSLNDRLMSAAQSRDTQRLRRELAAALAAGLADPDCASSVKQRPSVPARAPVAGVAARHRATIKCSQRATRYRLLGPDEAGIGLYRKPG